MSSSRLVRIIHQFDQHRYDLDHDFTDYRKFYADPAIRPFQLWLALILSVSTKGRSSPKSANRPRMRQPMAGVPHSFLPKRLQPLLKVSRAAPNSSLQAKRASPALRRYGLSVLSVASLLQIYYVFSWVPAFLPIAHTSPFGLMSNSILSRGLGGGPYRTLPVRMSNPASWQGHSSLWFSFAK